MSLRAKLGTAIIEFVADLRGFKAGTAQAKKETANAVAEIKGHVGEIASAFTGIALPATLGAALVKLGADAYKAADDTAMMAQRLGLSVEALSRLEYAAKMSDVSVEALHGAIRFLNKNLYDASRSAKGPAAAAFRSLGVAVRDQSGNVRAANEVLLEVAQRMRDTEDPAKRGALALRLFGRGGAEMLPLLLEGSDGIKTLTSESDRLGATISTEFAAQADEFDKSVKRLSGGVRGLGLDMMSKVMPALLAFGSMFGNVLPQSVGRNFGPLALFGKAIQGVLAVLTFAIGTVKNLAYWIANLGALIGGTAMLIVKGEWSQIRGFAREQLAQMQADGDRIRAETFDRLAESFGLMGGVSAEAAKSAGDFSDAVDDLADASGNLNESLDEANARLRIEIAQLEGNEAAAEKARKAYEALGRAKVQASGGDVGRYDENIRLQQRKAELIEAKQIAAETDRFASTLKPADTSHLWSKDFTTSARTMSNQLQAEIRRASAQVADIQLANARAEIQQEYDERVAAIRRMHAFTVEQEQEKDRLLIDAAQARDAAMAAADRQYGEEWRDMLGRMVDALGTQKQNVEGLVRDVAGEMQTLFGDVMLAGVKGNVEEMDEIFKGFLSNLQRRILDFMAQEAMRKLFKIAGGEKGSAFFDAIFNANGNVLPGGISMFADGGLVTTNAPRIGIVGEGHYDEAIVPLPDGRGIRAIVENGGGNTRATELTMRQTIVIAPEMLQAMKTSDDEVLTIVGSNIRRGGQLRDVIVKSLG